MQNSNSIITLAVEGIGVKLAELYDLSVARLYQILEADHYGKTKRLIRFIAAIDKSRIRLIKADLDALFSELLGQDKTVEVDCAYLHGELSDVIQAKLKKLAPSERLRECLEARIALDAEIAVLKQELRQRDDIKIQVFGDMNGNVKIG